jgi:hypothetical protein
MEKEGDVKMSRWGKILSVNDDEEIILEFTEWEIINPLCKQCAERIDSSITTRKDVSCIYGLEPEKAKKEERMGGTGFKCQKFNPISDMEF